MFPVGTGMNRGYLLPEIRQWYVPRRHGDEPYQDIGYPLAVHVPRRHGDEP